MGEKMSKANSNFDHLIRDKYGHKKDLNINYSIRKRWQLTTIQKYYPQPNKN